MKQNSAPMCAAIDIGSNTIHITIARCFQQTLEIVADEAEMVRIGESVTATGAISPEKCQATISTLHLYQALAAQYRVKHIFVVATEAIRQASNNAAFLAIVKEQTGLDVQLISGVTEAALTFLGTTYDVEHHQQMGVMDLGGGSLELVFAQDMRITWSTSFPIGSGWLHDRYLPSDPPTSKEIAETEAFLHTYFQGVPIQQHPPTLLVTGGSANSVFYLAQEAFQHPARPRRLTLEDLTHCQDVLSTLTSTEIAKLSKRPLARARLLLAGTLMIIHLMQRLRLQEILVSSHGIREGVLLAYARYGENWLERVGK